MKALLAIALILTAAAATAGEICYKGAKFTLGNGNVSFDVSGNTVTATLHHADGNFCMVSSDADIPNWGKCEGVNLTYEGTCGGQTAGKFSPVVRNVTGGVTINITGSN